MLPHATKEVYHEVFDLSTSHFHTFTNDKLTIFMEIQHLFNFPTSDCLCSCNMV